ncbi:hypothetical protein ACWD00_08570 [Streptomyces viridiviolaceus]
MSTEPRRSTAASLAALLVAALLLTGGPAHAADDPSAGQRIADALRSSPVYVAEAYADAVPPSRQQDLAEQIRNTGLPIKVVLIPLTKGDAFDGDSDVLAEVVRDRLPRRDLVLITTDSDFPDSLNGYEWPGDAHQTRDAVAAAGFLDEMRDADLADLAAKAVELVAEGNGTAVYEEATRDMGVASPSPPAEATRAEPASGWPIWPLAAVLALLTSAATAWALTRRARRSPSPTGLVFTTARAADRKALRRRAETEVLALGEATRSADPSVTPGLQRALDAYAAAGTVLDGARGIPDLAGVLALAAEGHDALTDTPATTLPLCFFNPLHGRSTDRITWRPLGRRDQLRVAACPRCTEAVRTRRPPEVLTDATADGRTTPYFDVPAERSVWAATGYGSLVQDAEEDGLAARVARGDFSRSKDGPEIQ